MRHVERGRAGRIIIAAAVVSMMMAGCSAVKSGNSPSEATRIIDAVPGLTQASVKHREIDETFGSKNIVVVSAKASGTLSANPSQLAQYLIEVGYSVNAWEPSSGLQVVINGYEGGPLIAALQDDGFTDVVQGTSEPGEFFVTAGVLKSKFGKWPGATPPPLKSN